MVNMTVSWIIIQYYVWFAGTLKQFATVLSSRTAIGHDKEGRVVIMQADGKTNHNGSVDLLL